MQSVAALPRIGLRDFSGRVWLAVGLLALLLIGVGYEQGLLVQLVLGGAGDTGNLLHELFHDGRHLLGFPCH
jgi:hypothetical protein